jgi:hypothetical protein
MQCPMSMSTSSFPRHPTMFTPMIPCPQSHSHTHSNARLPQQQPTNVHLRLPTPASPHPLYLICLFYPPLRTERANLPKKMSSAAKEEPYWLEKVLLMIKGFREHINVRNDIQERLQGEKEAYAQAKFIRDMYQDRRTKWASQIETFLKDFAKNDVLVAAGWGWVAISSISSMDEFNSLKPGATPPNSPRKEFFWPTVMAYYIGRFGENDDIVHTITRTFQVHWPSK